VPGKIFVILDGHPAHRATKTKTFVASTNGRLELYFLPPYSPELNPEESVRKNIILGFFRSPEPVARTSAAICKLPGSARVKSTI